MFSTATLHALSSANMRFCCHVGFDRNVFHSKLFKQFFRSHWRYKKITDNSKTKYLLVLDFEATCDNNNNKTITTQEIIEFPCLKVGVPSMNVEAKFHQYVRPIVNPELSVFCTELTGILQEMVDDSDTFPKVLEQFEEWRINHGLTDSNSIYVTSGDWDLGAMLPKQCSIAGVPIPMHMLRWIDLKKLYGRETGNIPKSLIEIIRRCGLQFYGRQHSGIDDCINIANVLRRLSPTDLNPTSELEVASNGFRVINHPV